MKDSTKEALFKFGEFCDSGKPWYCFFGVYLVTLIVNITLLLTSEKKPKWWSVALDVCGLALAASNIARTERMQKGVPDLIRSAYFGHSPEVNRSYYTDTTNVSVLVDMLRTT